MGPKVMVEVETLRRIRHELATLHGLWVTDRPEKTDVKGVRWRIDTSEMAESVDRAIGESGDGGEG